MDMSAYSYDDLTHIEAILHNLDLNKPTKSASRRKRERHQYRHKIDIFVLTPAGPVPGKVQSRNISTGGIGFVTRRPLVKGQRIIMCMTPQSSPAKLVLCRITFARHVSGGMYDVGAEFERAVADPAQEHTIPQEWLTLAAVDIGIQSR